MIIINMVGGPHAGKSTMAAYLYYRLKKAGIRAELVSEAAREHHIYQYPADRVPEQLKDNQVLVFGEQYERVLRLQRHNFEVAVCDSSLEQQQIYFKGHLYEKSLKAVVDDCAKHFDTYNVFIHPDPGKYDPESRTQRTETEARSLDKIVRELMGNFWLEINWDQESLLGDRAVQLVLSKRQSLPSTVSFSTTAPSLE